MDICIDMCTVMVCKDAECMRPRMVAELAGHCHEARARGHMEDVGMRCIR